MNISRDNYEPFFLDYLEGNLDDCLIDQFLDFLEQNPDLKEELHLFETINLPVEEVVFNGKKELIKTCAEEKYLPETRMIAYLEGDLDEPGKLSFETYLEEFPELWKEYQLYTKTRLVPDRSIHFPAKEKLIKKSGWVVLLNRAGRVAAVMVLVLGIGYLIETNWLVQKNKPETVLADLKSDADQVTQLNAQVDDGIKTIARSKDNPDNIQQREKRKAKLSGEENLDSAPVLATESGIRIEETMLKISPLMAQLNPVEFSDQLAISVRGTVEEKINTEDGSKLEQYFADRVKKIGNEGINSAQRILRTSLNVASELSGKRIGYQVKDGKISSVEFDSKLLAFSIPLKRN
jgi:hypothetical protein